MLIIILLIKQSARILHRPIGIGVQGLADALILMNVSYSSVSRTINSFIFETIYHASIEASNEIAIERMEGMKSLKHELKKKLYILLPSLSRNHHKINSNHLHNETQREGLNNMIERYNPIYSELNLLKTQIILVVIVHLKILLLVKVNYSLIYGR